MEKALLLSRSRPGVTTQQDWRSAEVHVHVLRSERVIVRRERSAPQKKTGLEVGDTPPRCQESQPVERCAEFESRLLWGGLPPAFGQIRVFVFGQLPRHRELGNRRGAAKHATPLVLSPDRYRAGIASAEEVGCTEACLENNVSATVIKGRCYTR